MFDGSATNTVNMQHMASAHLFNCVYRVCVCVSVCVTMNEAYWDLLSNLFITMYMCYAYNMELCIQLPYMWTTLYSLVLYYKQVVICNFAMDEQYFRLFNVFYCTIYNT